MHRTRTAIAVLALLFGAVLPAAGCSTIVPGQAVPAAMPAPRAALGGAPAPASPEGVAWADQVCGAFRDANAGLTDQPKPDVDDVAATLGAYRQYFERTIPALDAATTRLRTIGPGPLAGGGTVVDDMVAVMTLMRDAHVRTKAAVDAIDPASPTVMHNELPAALALTAIKDAAPKVDLAATPGLAAATDAAPNCQGFAR